MMLTLVPPRTVRCFGPCLHAHAVPLACTQAMLDKASSLALPTEEVVRLPLTRVRRGAAAAATSAAAAGMSAIKE